MKKIFAFLFLLSFGTFAQKDTLKFAMLQNGTKAGKAWLLHSAQNEFQSFADFQGNTIFTKYAVNDQQVITDLTTKNLTQKTIPESFSLKNNAAQWEIDGQKGEAKVISAVFLTQFFTPDNPLTRALLASPTKKTVILPNLSDVSMFLAYELTLKNKQKVFLFQINGVNPQPIFNWVDENGYTVAKIYQDKSTVRQGFEEYLDEFSRLQQNAEAKALKEAAKKPIAKGKAKKGVAKKKTVKKK